MCSLIRDQPSLLAFSPIRLLEFFAQPPNAAYPEQRGPSRAFSFSARKPMSSNDPRADVGRRPLVLELPGMMDVVVQANARYREGDDGVFDVYRAADATPADRRPAVIFVTGYPDAGVRRVIGCAAKEMESYITWARAVAASGFAGVTYTNSEPERDASLVLQHIRTNAASLGIDAGRLAIWSCSGNGPNALGLLMRHREDIRCAVLYYACTLDLDGSTAVAEAQARFRFANPTAGRTLDDLPSHLPLCVVRAGQDATHRLNEALDRFVARLIEADRPLTFVNVAGAPHAFDVMSDTDAARSAIKQTLGFLSQSLIPSPCRARFLTCGRATISLGS